MQGAIPIDLNTPDTKLTARGGVDTRFSSFSGNDVTLLDVVTNSAGADDEVSARGSAGLDFTHDFTEQASLPANGEVRAGTSGLGASLSLGFKAKF